MKEIRDILSRVSTFADDDRAILATVIDVHGSGYRLPAARMLILPNGETFGTVSGGCLEADVMERAKKVLKTGLPEVFTYDTTEDENSVFSMNMGCRGVIRILLEPIGRDGSLVGKLRAAMETRESQTIATLISAETAADANIGGRVYLSASTEFVTDGLPRFLTDLPELRNACTRFLASGSAYDFETFETPEGKFEFVFESAQPPISILLFGAGADAMPMARIVTEVGWQVTVFDHRPAFLTRERFPSAANLVLQKADGPLDPMATDRRTAGVIMTHNYGCDRLILPFLLRSNVFYVGALGPKKRTAQLLDEIASGGESIAEMQLAKLYAPVGLDIGGGTPESIALSIVGEIQSMLSGRKGGHLRDRNGSIYDRK